jgi:hypothetical protein
VYIHQSAHLLGKVLVGPLPCHLHVALATAEAQIGLNKLKKSSLSIGIVILCRQTDMADL